MDVALALSIKIPYQKFPVDSGFSYRAVLPVYISLPQKNAIRSKKIEAIIDSGANDCIFHASVGEALGFDVKKGKASSTFGVNGGSCPTYFHDMYLFAAGAPITISAAFCYELPIVGLLGMQGFFNHFKITFDPTAKRCELERIYQA